jgi:hypothetical protein
MSDIRLFVLPEDPDAAAAEELLRRAGLNVVVVDVEKTGMLPFLDRDLGINALPFLVADSRMYEGLSMIRSFADRLVAA